MVIHLIPVLDSEPDYCIRPLLFVDRMSCDKDSLCKACLYDKNYGSHVCTTEDCPTCSHVTNDSPQVCGDDGNTYENECMLRRHACLNRINISVKHAAPCGGG